MRLPRFTIAQLLVLVVLVGIAAAFVRATGDHSPYDFISQVCFSPDGTKIAASHDLGCDVWYLDSHPPRHARVLTESSFAETYTHVLGFCDNDTLLALRADNSAYPLVITTLLLIDVETTRVIHDFEVPFEIDSYLTRIDRAERTVAFPDSTMEEVEVWQIDSGRRLRRFPIKGELTAPPLVADDRCLQYVRRSGALYRDWYIDDRLTRMVEVTGFQPDVGDAGTWSIESGTVDNSQIKIVDIAQGTSETSRVLPRPLEYVACTPDKTHFVATSGLHELTLVDAQSETRVATLDMRDHLKPNVMEVHLARYLATRNGQRVAIAFDQLRDGIHIWEPASGKLVQLRSGVSRALLVTLFASAFMIWAIVWGWMHRRQAHVQPAKEAPDSIQAHPVGRPRTGCAALAFLVLVLILLTAESQTFTWNNLLWLIGFGVLWFFVVLVFLVFGMSWIYRLRGKPHHPRLRRAEQLAGCPPAIVRLGKVHAAFYGDTLLASTIEKELEVGREAVSFVFGRDVEYRKDLLLICFADSQPFQHYTAIKAKLTGVFFSQFQKQIVLAEEACRECLSTPATQLHTLLGYYFSVQECGKLPTTWLSATINMAVVMRTRPDIFAKFTRMYRARHARIFDDPQLNFVNLQSKDIVQLIKNPDKAVVDRNVLSIQLQAYALAQYLLFSDDERRRRFHDFLQSRDTRRKNAAELLAQRYDGTVDAMTAASREFTLQLPTAATHPIPELIVTQMQQVMVPRAVDTTADLETRREAIRNLGSCGSFACFTPLLNILRSEEGAIRTDATYSLELLSGETFADDVGRWESWWAHRVETDRVEGDEIVAAVSVEPVTAQFADSIATGDGEGGDATAVQDVVTASVTSPAAGVTDTSPEPFRKIPRRVQAVWWLLGIGGAAAILRAVVAGFGFWFDPYSNWYAVFALGGLSWLMYLNLAAGVFALTRAVGRYRQTLDFACLALTSSVLACDVVALICGLAGTMLLRAEVSKAFLRGWTSPPAASENRS